jgi:hypothetical protein
MHCNHAIRRLRLHKRPAQPGPQPAPPPEVLIERPLPAGLVQQLACPITDMAEVERLLAHLYCARARGYF